LAKYTDRDGETFFRRRQFVARLLRHACILSTGGRDYFLAKRNAGSSSGTVQPFG
jgi:hypothetical protein